MNTKPKSAEEWTTELCNDKHPHAMWSENITNFVKLIQLDAYRAGMMRGAGRAVFISDRLSDTKEAELLRQVACSIIADAQQLTEKGLQ